MAEWWPNAGGEDSQIVLLGYTSEIQNGPFGPLWVNGQQISQLKTVGRLMRPLQTGSLVGICNDA